MARPKGKRAAGHEAVGRKIFPLWQEGRCWTGKKWKDKGARTWKQILRELDLPGNEKYYRPALSEFIDRLHSETLISRLEVLDKKQYYWDNNSAK